MKYIIFIAFALMSAMLPAQSITTSSSTSVSESSTNDSYAFSIKVDRKRVDDLVSAYIKVAEIDGISKIVGTSIHSTDEGTEMYLNTKKRTLRISSDDDRPESIAIARALADSVREELNLAPAPAPPRE